MTSPAALQGASLAFHKRKPSAPGASVVSPSRSNGALTAATLSAQSTGTSIVSSHHGLPPDRNVIASRLQQLGHGQHHQFLEPPGNKGHDGKNASFIAATLAASRSASPSPRRRVSAGSLSAVEEREKVVDEGSIGTAGSLINMFEGGKRHSERVESPDRTPKKSHGRTRSLTPSPALDPTSRPLRLDRSPRREPYAGIPTKLAPNGLPPKPNKPPKPVVRSITPPPNPRISRRAPTAEWSSTGAREGPDPPFGNPSKSVGKHLKPSPRPITPPPKPLAESQPRMKDRTPRLDDDELKKTKPIAQSPVTLSKKPSKPPKPAPPLETPPRELPASQSTIESVSYNTRKQSPTRSPTLRTPRQPMFDTSSPAPIVNRSQTEVLSPKPTRVSKPHLPPPTPPQYQRGVSRPAPESHPQTSPGDPQKKDTPSKPQPPTPPKPRGSTRLTRTPTSPSHHGASRPKVMEDDRKVSEADSNNEVFVSAPTSPDYSSPPLPMRRQSAAKSSSPTRLSIHGTRPSRAASSSNLNLDSLTSAMMAGSLAASRLTPSNTGSSLPPPSRQRSPRLRQTMRKTTESSDSEEDKHKKGRRRAKLRSGKHAHHEGSRKKWRDEIRPRERKRYEAVWASNRGLHLPTPSTPASSVHSGKQPDYANWVANVVVRDIWRRSRLPEDEMGEVWNLVDREKRGVLGRAEFVVGMWLIDQRLKGRKIPTKVSESVWGSANGVRVTGPKRR